MKKFGVYLSVAVLGTLPGLAARLSGFQIAPLLSTLIFGGAILAAGFMLSWGLEAAEEHVSQGLAIAVLALITVLPEYAVDIYYTWQAGQNPGSPYVQYAAANMTGANRLLVGTAWPLIVLLFWWRSGNRAVQLNWENAAEVAYLALASLYSFFITLKGQIDLFDMVVLLGIFGAYVWRLSQLPKKVAVSEEEETKEVGPAAYLEKLSPNQQRLMAGLLAVYAALVILFVAEPFAESLVKSGEALGINEFLLIQWIAPVAGEAPEIVIAILLTLSFKPTAALGALISDKINQWTLLVGMIPLVFSLSSGRVAALPLNARQHEEFFLTAAQSLFAMALLLRLSLGLGSALVLLVLFFVQLVLGFVFRNDEATTILVLTQLAWFYLLLAGAMLIFNRHFVASYFKVGLLNRPSPETTKRAKDKESQPTG